MMTSDDSAEAVGGENALEAAFYRYTVSQSIIIALTLLLLPLEWWGYWEYCFDKTQRATTSSNGVIMFRMRTCLVLNGLFSLVSESLSLADAISVNLSAEACSALAKAMCVIYAVATCFAYLFLLQKVKLVSRFCRNWLFVWILWSMERMFVFVLPINMAFYAIVAQGALVGDDESKRCVQDMPLWTFWAFTALNLVISGSLIYLFVAPLRGMLSTGISTVQADLRRMFWRNLAVSTFAVVFTSATVLAYGVMEAKTQASGRPEYGVIGVSVLSWDVFVLIACCRLTTFVWLPRRLREWGRTPSLPGDATEEEEDENTAVVAVAAGEDGKEEHAAAAAAARGPKQEEGAGERIYQDGKAGVGDRTPPSPPSLVKVL